MAPLAPAQAADDLPIVGDIPMPHVDVEVRLGRDAEFLPPPPPLRPQVVYPRRLYAASPPRHELPPDGPAVSQLDIVRMLRSTGYALLGPVNRRGWVYTVSVIDPRGDDGRAIIDARTGAVIRFIPALAVNARLDDRLGEIYGPPGPPPIVQNIGRSMKPQPRTVSRDAAPKPLSPKVADRIQAPSPGPDAAQSRPADARAEMKPAPVPQAPAKPAEIKLWPTQGMPDVQPLE